MVKNLASPFFASASKHNQYERQSYVYNIPDLDSAIKYDVIKNVIPISVDITTFIDVK